MIFGNRWGDAPLRWLTLALFAARTELLCFGGEYDYRHRGPQDHCALSFNLSRSRAARPPAGARRWWSCRHRSPLRCDGRILFYVLRIHREGRAA